MSLTIIPAEFLPPIDGVVIGGITPAAGSFTTLNATGESELGNRVAANGVQPRYDLIESDTANVNTRFSNTGGSLLIQTINDALDTATTRLTIDHTTGAATFTGEINTNSNGVLKTIGGDLAMVQGAIGLRINTASNAISPTTATLNNDAAVDIGVNNIRFRNAFLSGTVNAGAAAFTGDIELSGANAEINLKAGVGGTSGAINWTFNTGTTNFASIKLPYDTRATIGLHLDAGYPITIDASTYIAFAASGVENMHLTASGNLGVGITPDALTRVHAHGSADVASFTQTNSANSQRLEMGNAFSLITSGNGAMSAIVSDSILLFGIGSTEHMRLITSGNLLLGTTTSSAKLSVVGDGSAQPIAQFKGGTAGDLAVAGLHISKFDNNNTTSQILARFYMNQGGTAQGMITANGASAAAFTAFSDATLKENITTLPDQYDNIRALRPVEFDYIESEGGGHQVGFIAQEMQAVYPCCVGEREDGKLTITGWSKTEARLVSALRSAMDKIDVLTARLDAAGL
jgi:hypothetical protein